MSVAYKHVHGAFRRPPAWSYLRRVDGSLDATAKNPDDRPADAGACWWRPSVPLARRRPGPDADALTRLVDLGPLAARRTRPPGRTAR